MWKLLGFTLLCVQVFATNNLNIKFQWKQIDYDFPTEASRRYALDHEDFIPENNLPLGLEVYENRLFITVPRWKAGVAASLNYVDITDSNPSPKLRPYPNWPAHNLKTNSSPEIVSPFRMRADQCDRLWVLDSGTAELLGDAKILAPPRISIYNLKNDSLIRQFVIPREHLSVESFLANIAVEVVNCEDTFAYMSDLGKGALVVYSWKNNTAWRITHSYFNADPLSGDFNVSGVVFEWKDALFGIALSPLNEKGFSTLYFHPMVSQNEFAVSTEVLRDPELAKNSHQNFTLLGTRGTKGQSTASFLNPKTNVLFYGLVNRNSVGCWKTTEPYQIETQGNVYQDDVTMVFPNDLKVDYNDNLWVLSDRIPKFMYQKLDPMDVNFRIFTGPVSEAIKGTVCDTENATETMDRFVTSDKLQETTTKSNENSSAARISFKISTIFLFIFFAMSW